MNWWDLVREAGDAFLLQHGVLAAFAYLALEEGGLPIPVPGDFLMLAFGVRAREGSIVLWQVIAAMEAGTVLGSSLLYLLARRGGRGVVDRYGPFIGIGPAQLDRAQTQLQRYGAFAVVLWRRAQNASADGAGRNVKHFRSGGANSRAPTGATSAG